MSVLGDHAENREKRNDEEPRLVRIYPEKIETQDNASQTKTRQETKRTHTHADRHIPTYAYFPTCACEEAQQ